MSKQPQGHGDTPHLRSSYGAAAPHSNALRLRGEFDAMLERLCQNAALPVADQPWVLADRIVEINGFGVAFQLDESVGRVKILVDVGEPPFDRAHEIHRWLLEQHLYLQADFNAVSGVDELSGHIVLYAHAPVPADVKQDARCVTQLAKLTTAARRVRNKWLHPARTDQWPASAAQSSIRD